ncbi:MAG: DUF3617 domain-containing protein [Rhodocyclaceae bacterium]|nr:DUF3617 domain-containing protein [Rhodocyclaceae bacterium]
MNRKLLVLAAACILSSVAFGASGIKPGMWEVTTQTALPGGMAMPNMADLPPEAQAMMAKRGISMQGGAGGGMTVRHCVTKEQAARDEPPQPPNSHCRNTSFSRSGNTVSWQTTCVEGGRTMNGKGTMTFNGSDSYSGSTTINVNDPQHGSMNTTTQMQGRWVGNCQ